MSAKKQLRKKLQGKISLKEAKPSVPYHVKQFSLSLFLFMMGRGLGGDTFFSIYVSSIVESKLGLTLIGAFLAFVKLIVVIPIGVLNDRIHPRYLVLLGKMVYLFSGVFYFSAGMTGSVLLLLVAVALNALGSGIMFTSYRTLYGKKTQKKNRSKIFGIYYSSINFAYVLGALISAVIIAYIDLPFMYLFIVIFALFSILQDRKSQNLNRAKILKKWEKYGNKKRAISFHNIDSKDMRVMVGKEGVMRTVFKEFFSFASRKKIFTTLKKYDHNLYAAFGAQGLVSFMSYVGFLFIPIIAVENNLSLSEIAILFAVMRIPYVINVIIGGFGDKYSKKVVIASLIFVSSILYLLFGVVEGFYAIVLVSFWVSLMVAFLSPVTNALIMDYCRPEDRGLMTGVQEFISRCGEIIGSLGFGTLTALIGIKTSFMLLGIALAVLGSYLLLKKMIKKKTLEELQTAFSEGLTTVPM